MPEGGNRVLDQRLDVVQSKPTSALAHDGTKDRHRHAIAYLDQRTSLETGTETSRLSNSVAGNAMVRDRQSACRREGPS
jgi:hypothetical protein